MNFNIYIVVNIVVFKLKIIKLITKILFNHLMLVSKKIILIYLRSFFMQYFCFLTSKS